MAKREEADEEIRCSFCHKSAEGVGRLISSPADFPRAYICNECVGVCNSILEDESAAAVPAAGRADPVAVDLAPDVARAFPDAASVNDALRQLLTIAMRVRTTGG